MGNVDWSTRPDLDHPVLIAAFEGWNDAGDAATSAAKFLQERWKAEPFAELDTENFTDYTTVRPRVELDGDDQRQIVWPRNQFSAASGPTASRDVIVLVGNEPQLRWKTFCAEIIDLARQLDVGLVVTLGALLAEVPHTRPVSVIGTAYDGAIIERLGLRKSTYEGPTGIVGVLHDQCRAAQIESASLWAAVPSYVPAAYCPKAAIALVEQIGVLLDVPIPALTELEIAAASYERQVGELVDADDETAEYLAELESRYDDKGDDFPTPDSLIEEVERFLRDS